MKFTWKSLLLLVLYAETLLRCSSCLALEFLKQVSDCFIPIACGIIVYVNRCGMGPLLVLVSPCFRENVVVTCKIGSFLCSLDNLLQKNVIVFFFGNQISKWRSFEKRAIFDLLFTFLITMEKLQKFLQHISHSYTYMYFAHPIGFFFYLTNFEKKV